MMMRLTSFVLALSACTGSDGSVLTSLDAPPGADPDASAGWTAITSPTTHDLYAVQATSTGVLAAGGTPGSTVGEPGVVVAHDGSTWTATAHPINVLALTPGMAIGEYGGEASITHRDGAEWAPRVVVGVGWGQGGWETTHGAYAVHNRVSAATNDGVLLYDSSATDLGWQVVDTGTTASLFAVWSPSSTEAYAVGAGGLILHTTDAGPGSAGTWTPTVVGTSTLRAIWGSSADDVYIVGESPAVILRSTDRGTTWTEEPLPPSVLGLFGITGRAATEVYAVGATAGATTTGLVIRSSGDGQWTSEAVPTTAALNAITIAPSDDIIAVGRGGAIVSKAP